MNEKLTKFLPIIMIFLLLFSACSTTSETKNEEDFTPILYTPYFPDDENIGPKKEEIDTEIDENLVENYDNYDEIIIDFEEENEENREIIYYEFDENQEEIIEIKDENTRNFKWNYDDFEYEITFNVDEEYYNFFKNRERNRDFDLFVSDEYSKDFIEDLTQELEKYAKNSGLNDDEIPYFVISFVQHLPYTSDDVTTGFDEYPRFPYETFYENGGDCEDSFILASAILNEMGYGVALLTFPKHVAVGVKCDHNNGESYYSYQEIDYCYLETTGKNWDIGTIPESVESDKAIVNPIYSRVEFSLDFDANYEYDSRDVYVNVDVNIKNLGSKKAENTQVYVALLTSDETKVWDHITSENLQIEPENSYEYSVENLHAPTGNSFKIYVRATSENGGFSETYSNWIEWK